MIETCSCANCGIYLDESMPREHIDENVYCGECAFKLGFISDEEYIRNYLYFIQVKGVRAAVYNNEIYVGFGKFSWEKTSRDRYNKEYIEWRTNVFTRDEFRCQLCGRVGGKLNAHHIKSYKDYPLERHNINNGITLCEECHKRVHKEKNSEWIYSNEPFDDK